MPWERPSASLSTTLAAALADVECQLKPMFGCPAYFAGSQMFACVHQQHLILRLPADERQRFLATYRDAGPFEPMPGRQMREYVSVPEEVAADPGTLGQWVERAHAYALSLPPKAPKEPKPRRTRSGG